MSISVTDFCTKLLTQKPNHLTKFYNGNTGGILFNQDLAVKQEVRIAIYPNLANADWLKPG